MNWKQFLKPNIKKVIIIFIILLLGNAPYIGTFRGEKTGCVCPLCVGCICDCPEDISFEFQLNPVFWPPFLRLFVILDSSSITKMIPIINFHSPLSFDFNVPDGYVQFFGIIIYWYLLSCLIVWTYDKLKTKLKGGKK